MFVALGGTAFAVTSINGSSIVDHTIRGRKLVNNTLTGTQVNESTLGLVPTASNARTVGGLTVRKVFYAPGTATGTATKLVSLGGLTVKAVCVPGGGGLGIVQILATTAFTHAHLASVMWNSGSGGQADGLHVTDFSGQTEDLTDSNDWGETTFTYTRSGGVVVGGDLTFDDSEIIGGNIFGHTAKCLISGFVTSSAAS
ncbi:MAG: hypothetical protein ACJ77A_04060 [Actinomycetota bacterium]